MNIVINGHKDSLNNGNILMVLGLLEGLKRRHIFASLTLLSDLPEVDRKRYKDTPSLEIIGRPWSRQKKGALLAVATAFIYGLWVLVGRTIESLLGHRLNSPWNPLSRAYGCADLALDVSGDDLTTAYSWVAPLQVLYELFLAKLFGAKTMLIAQSIGPFDSLFMRVVARLLQHLTDFVTLRDADSFLFWQEILFPDKSRHDTPDHPLADLMHLNEMPMAAAESDFGPIVINLSNYAVESALRLEGKSTKSSGLHHHMTAWAKLLEHFHLSTGRELLLLPHTFRPGKGDDRYWLRRLHERCSSRLPVRQIDEPLTTSVIQEIVARSSFVVSSRMHLALTAMKCGVPFISIAYSHKYRQLIPSSFLGISPVITLSEHRDGRLFRAIEKRFDLLWHNRQAYQDSVKSYAREASALAEENINFLAMMVNSSKRDC